MSERVPAPGGLVLVQGLVNTLDMEGGVDGLDTADGRARFGLTSDEVSGARELRESLRVTLLARDKAGWGRLCRVVSAAHAAADGGAPVASWEALREHAGVGLTVLLGPASEPVRARAAGRPDRAERLLAPWRELVGASLRLEVLWYGLPGTGPGSLRLAARTLGLADQLGIPAVLTNAVRYADPGQHRLADVLDSARLLRPIDRRRLDCGERSLKDPAAMAEAAARIAMGASADQARGTAAGGDRTDGRAVRCRPGP